MFTTYDYVVSLTFDKPPLLLLVNVVYGCPLLFGRREAFNDVPLGKKFLSNLITFTKYQNFCYQNKKLQTPDYAQQLAITVFGPYPWPLGIKSLSQELSESSEWVTYNH